LESFGCRNTCNGFSIELVPRKPEPLKDEVLEFTPQRRAAVADEDPLPE